MKKSIIKKIFVLAVCAVMVVPAYTDTVKNANAANSSSDTKSTDSVVEYINDKKFMECVEIVSKNHSIFGIDDNMIDASIGKPFYVAEMSAKDKVCLNTSSTFIPIVNHNKIVSMIIAHGKDGNNSYTISKSFSDELTKALSNKENIALISDEFGNIMSVSENNITNIICMGDETFCTDIDDEYNLIYDNVDDFNNVVNSSIYEDTCLKLQDLTGNSDRITATRTITNLLPNYPCCTQGGANCWAFAVLSMAKYKITSSYQIEMVYAKHTTANGANAPYTLSTIYNTIVEIFSDYSPEKKNSKITNVQIAKNIQQDYPIFIKGTRTKDDGTVVAHAVVLMGYEKTGNNLSGYYVMNPQNGTIQYETYSHPDCYFHHSNGLITYRWNGTVTLNGTLQ